MEWTLRLVQTGADGDERCTDVMAIKSSDDLADIADLGLSRSDAKQVLASLQQAIVAGQARDHAVRRPDCRRCLCLMPPTPPR